MAIDSMRALWNEVCANDEKFGSFRGGKDAERRFLRALHSKDALEFIAKTLTCDRPVAVCSAFIDVRPKFEWAGGAGEIADILLIVDRVDHKDAPRIASLIQAKVSDKKDEVDFGKSTEQQIALYKHWPKISFKDAVDIEELDRTTADKDFCLNIENKTWPFPFLKFINISKLAEESTSQPEPKWTQSDDEPFSVMGEIPDENAVTLTTWLHKIIEFASRPMEVIEGKERNVIFDSLAKSLLVVLAKRQKDGKLAHSGGDLINSIRFNNVVQKIPHDKISRWSAPQEHQKLGFKEDDEGFLVLYIRIGREGVDEPIQPTSNTSQFPGANLIL